MTNLFQDELYLNGTGTNSNTVSVLELILEA